MVAIHRWVPLSMVVLGLMAPLALAEEAATPDQLRELLTEKKYGQVIQQASRTLTMGGEAAKDVDRYDLMMIKGEAQLMLKQNLVAADTFTAAAHNAQGSNDSAMALATAELAKHSPGLKYRPAGNGTPIDISDPTDRKTAFSALFTDLFAKADPGIKAAKEASDLYTIMDEAKRLSTLKAIEVAATGSDTQTTGAVKDLGSHGGTLMTTELHSLSEEIKRIHDAANTTQTIWQNGTQYSMAPGLGSRDKDRLKDIMDECDKITEAAKELADATGADSLSGVGTESEKVKADAQAALTATYTGNNTNNPYNNQPPPNNGQPYNNNPNGTPLTPAGAPAPLNNNHNHDHNDHPHTPPAAPKPPPAPAPKPAPPPPPPPPKH